LISKTNKNATNKPKNHLFRTNLNYTMNNKQDIAIRIREIIHKKGMSITQFATGAKIDQSNLSSILNGKRSIGSGVISKIALAYDINIEWLTSGEGEMYKRDTNLCLHEPSAQNSREVEYKEKYINQLENEIVLLRKTLEEQSTIIQGFINGSISKIKD
jgi:transcriptional regulator with XRE-family HTH domain